jgi:uncharacterized protein YerC
MSNSKVQTATDGVQALKKIAAIPVGKSWNKEPEAAPVAPRVIQMHSLIAPAIVDNLPGVLKEGVNRLIDSNDKLVFLVSALGLLSGVLPNVKGHYGGRWVSANLYAFIVGGFGTGKGAMAFAKQLIEPIEQQILKENEAQALAFEQLDKDEKEDKRPIEKELVIEGNSSASMMLQILHESDGRGILFETEADTIVKTFSSEHGNYSDILRKAFHHEKVGFTRRAGNERRKVQAPELSVVITATPEQLPRLIPDARNGLFSRFLYLTIEAESGWRNPFDRAKTEYEIEFAKMGNEVLGMYNELLPRKAPRAESETARRLQPAEFTFTPEQQRLFNAYYSDHKGQFLKDTGREAAGVYHRLALINFRVAMVLACVREYSISDGIPDELVCSDTDYKTAKMITDILTDETKRIYYDLPDTRTEADTEDEADSETIEQAKRVVALIGEGWGYRAIATELGISAATVTRRKKLAFQTGLVSR